MELIRNSLLLWQSTLDGVMVVFSRIHLGVLTHKWKTKCPQSKLAHKTKQI